jgi:hypothetical protein
MIFFVFKKCFENIFSVFGENKLCATFSGRVPLFHHFSTLFIVPWSPCRNEFISGYIEMFSNAPIYVRMIIFQFKWVTTVSDSIKITKFS